MKELSEIRNIFLEGRDFEKVLILDNFDSEIDILNSSSSELSNLLGEIIKSSDNTYIIRSAFVILCDLTLTGIIINEHVALTYLKDFLKTANEVLQIIALKYLPRFLDAYSKEMVSVITLSDSDNADIASQAHFCMGFAALMNFSPSQGFKDVILRLGKAKQHFLAAKYSVENRSDAAFFLMVIECFEGVLLLDQPKWKAAFSSIEKNLKSRSLYQLCEAGLEFDFLVFKLIEQLKYSLELAVESDGWIEFYTPLRSLCDLHFQIHTLQNLPGVYNNSLRRLYQSAGQTIENHIYTSFLTSSKKRLHLLKESVNEDDLEAFLTTVLSQIPEGKENNKENLELLALLSSGLGAIPGLNIYEAVKNKETPEIEAIKNLLELNNFSQLAYRTGSIPGQEVLHSLMKQIDINLPDYPVPKRKIFFNILEEVIRYTRTTFVGHEKKKFSFLYSKTERVAGRSCLGEDAKEEDLQDSMLDFFLHSKIADGLDHEKSKFVDGGRVDIVYTKDIMTIPIELKKSLSRPNQDVLETNYIAQAQTYTAGYDQLGIFVLLELSDKSKEPPPNFKDWFSLHHLAPSTNLSVKHPDLVVSVVIPGNRVTPSAKSTYG